MESTSFVFSNTDITADITLYAKWTINQYTVTFDPSGGRGVNPTTKSVNHGSKTSAPSTPPTRIGYTFDGWFVKKTDGSLESTSFVFSNTNITADITLYAKWTINQYTVTFDPSGGRGVNPTTKSVNHGSKTSAPSTPPTRIGYTFDGWFVKKTDGSLESTSFVFSNTDITAAITLYAKWTNVAPRVTGVTIDSIPNKSSAPNVTDTYGDGAQIRIKLSFSEDVKVTGTTPMEIGIVIGSDNKVAKHTPQTSSSTYVNDLVFEYTVQASDADNDGFTVIQDSLDLKGGTIEDRAGAALPTLSTRKSSNPAYTQTTGHKVDGTKS